MGLLQGETIKQRVQRVQRLAEAFRCKQVPKIAKQLRIVRPQVFADQRLVPDTAIACTPSARYAALT